MIDGYAKATPVTFTTRSDMQESVWGFTSEDLAEQWTYALERVSFDDPNSLLWFASLSVRRIEELGAATD